MDFGMLGTFIAVYTTGSFNKATRSVCMSAQGIGKSIAQLENELGCQLFVRSRQGAVPTDAACKLYPYIRDLIDACEEVRIQTTAQQGLRVAVVSGTLSFVGPSFAEDFRTENPSIELRLEEGTNRIVEEALDSRTADVGLLAGPVDTSRYDVTLFSSHPHVLIASKNDPIASYAAVPYSALEGRRVIMLGRDYPVMDTLHRRLAEARVAPKELVGTSVVNDMVPTAIADGSVVIGANYWAQRVPGNDHVLLPFQDSLFCWNVFLTRRIGEAPSLAADAFWDYALRWAASHRDVYQPAPIEES